MALIDISVSINVSIPVWPGDEPPLIKENVTNDDEGTIHTSVVTMNVHTGTHIDAPKHFYPTGKVASDLSLDRLCGNCQVLEIPPAVSLITKGDILRANFVKNCPRVLFKTNNSRMWKAEGSEFFPEYTALAVSGAQFLIDAGVDFVGIDYLSIAPYSNVWDVHQALLSRQIVILEGINLDAVKAGIYELLCLPLKLDSQDGLPVRAVLRER